MTLEIKQGSAGVQQVPVAPSVVLPAEASSATKPQVKSDLVAAVDMQKLHQDLTSTLEKINSVMRDGGRNLSFGIDHSLNGPVVVVKNSDTGEVVREIPNEAVVRVAHSIDALKGILFSGLI
jgi:flagellar protein FlaG